MIGYSSRRRDGALSMLIGVGGGQVAVALMPVSKRSQLRRLVDVTLNKLKDPSRRFAVSQSSFLLHLP